jgi:hypothetical protein
MNATRLVAIDYGDDDAGVLPTISTTHSIDLDNRQRQSIIAKITVYLFHFLSGAIMIITISDTTGFH